VSFSDIEVFWLVDDALVWPVMTVTERKYFEDFEEALSSVRTIDIEYFPTSLSVGMKEKVLEENLVKVIALPMDTLTFI